MEARSHSVLSNMGLAAVITACQPTEGSAHGTSGSSSAWFAEEGVEEGGSSRWRPGQEGARPRGGVCGRVHTWGELVSLV